MGSRWWTESSRYCLVEQTIRHRVEVIFIDRTFAFGQMPAISELGRIHNLFMDDTVFIIGNPRHPWSTWNRQRLFYAVKDQAFPDDEAYRVS